MRNTEFRKPGWSSLPLAWLSILAIPLAVALTAAPTAGSAAEPEAAPRSARGLWEKHKPDFLMGQSAGYVGYLAAGIGWRPGALDHHEFATLIGYVPETIGGVEIWQFTFKYTWIPMQPRQVSDDLYWDPVLVGLSVIRGYHENLWVRQPEQYPANYYNPTALHATFNLGTSLRYRDVEWFIEFAALDRGLAAYFENPEFFQENYAYYGLEGIGSLALGAKVDW